MNAPTTTRWEIQVVNPVDGRPKRWDVYDSRERAESVAATLRQHGFWCQVRRVDDDVQRVDDDPEHRGDRRRFLVWATMAGFAKPERLTERIVADVEEQTR